MLTLAIFMLALVFAGAAPVMAAKTAPDGAPASSGSTSSTSGDDGFKDLSPEGEAVKNSIQGPITNAKLYPYLEELDAFNGSAELSLSPAFASDTYIYEVNVPWDCDELRLKLNPKYYLGKYGILPPLPEYADRIFIETDSSWEDKYYDITNEDYILDTAITLNDAGLVTTNTVITVKVINDDVFGEWGDDDRERPYTITVHRAPLIPVTGVSLELGGDILAEGAKVFMSRYTKTLEAVCIPEDANYPNPLYYDWDWVVVGDQDAVTCNTNDEEITIDPDPDKSATVYLSVEVKDGEGTDYASASCIIYVGKISIWADRRPEFNTDGSYEASFSYKSTFPVNVTIIKTGDIDETEEYCWGGVNSFWGSGEIEGERPEVFETGTHDDEFRVKYWDGKQKWTVGYEGSWDTAEVDTYKSISLDTCFEAVGLEDEFDITADPSFRRFGGYFSTDEEFQEEISWAVVGETGEGVVEIDAPPNQTTCHVIAKKPGIAIIGVSLGDDECNSTMETECFKGKEAFTIVYVHDDRTLDLDQNSLSVRRGRTAQLTADIGLYEDLTIEELDRSWFGVPEDWNEVKWGFLAEDGWGQYIVPASAYAAVDAAGENKTLGTVEGLKKGKATVVAYLENNFYSNVFGFLRDIGMPQSIVDQMESELNCKKFYTRFLPGYRYDTCEVTVKTKKRVEEVVKEIVKPAPPEPPAPPVLDTLDVTITVGSQLALVNGAEITLAGNPILIGEDRVLVDYADMAQLIPGLEYVWDWQEQSVTFTKDGKELKMVLDQIPPDFDIPFLNIGGRLIVPVRYVGNFFGAAVDWIGQTLVVHMYK